MRTLHRLQPRRPDRVVHGYVYYRWTDRYIAVVRYFLDRPAFGPVRRFAGDWLERTHHAKVVPAEDARRIITVDRPIDWRGLERVVPFRTAHDIVLDAPARIALAPCACRTVAERHGARNGSCGPIESCLYVGDPIASFVAERQQGARLVSAEEALAVLESASAAGSIHTLWFKDAAHGRMYAICNCCTCCCIGMKARNAGFDPLASSGYVAEVDQERCTACGACVRACPFKAIAVGSASGSTAGRETAAGVDAEPCLGCGACAVACPEGAMRLVRAHGGIEPLPWEDEDVPVSSPAASDSTSATTD